MEPVWKKTVTEVDGKFKSNWRIDEFTWNFSSYTDLKEWIISDEPHLGKHLSNCSFLKRDRKPYHLLRPAPLPAMAQGTQVKNYRITYDS